VSGHEHLVRAEVRALRPYRPGRPAEEVRRERGLEDVVKLASNEGPFPPMPGALDAMRAAAGQVNLYPDGAAWGLRGALAERLDVPAEAILTGAGIDGLINVVVAATLGPGDVMAIGWPSFVSWPLRARVAGGTVREVPLAADGAYDLDALADAVDDATRLVVVVSPNNPTGGAVSAAALERFLDRLPPSVLPVVDEAYFEYLPAGGHDAVALLRAGRPLLAMRTFSKAYGLAGLRVGYAVGPAELIARLGAVRNAFDVNAIAQAAAIASLADAPEHLPARLAETASERAALAGGLRALGLAPLASRANFVLVELGEERAAAVNEALLDQGVIVRPAGPFGAPGALRISVGRPHENARLLAAMGAALAAAPA
jgi:histidinol-phosphate aminotransferase